MGGEAAAGLSPPAGLTGCTFAVDTVNVGKGSHPKMVKVFGPGRYPIGAQALRPDCNKVKAMELEHTLVHWD
ncbi:hypothetical protein EYF80_016046 [Liparis tanakae]|uniref:Uncharacterized protein n=1 Tax=Liparis tanakae TaxID=230148 RepID=A0A4Z2I6J4_9TELE|nr:hypothetical protein EYF80_016046 [Liparis tanakae]